MPLPPLPLVDGALFIDNSSWIEPLQTCHRLLEYRSLRKRVRDETKSALTFGSAIHQALEYRYLKCGSDRPEPWMDDDVASILQGLFEDTPSPEGDFRTLNWAVEVLRRYNQRYSLEEFSLLKYDKPVKCPYCCNSVNPYETCDWCDGGHVRETMIEVPFILSLYTHNQDNAHPFPIPVYYIGKVDLPILLDDKLYIIDHKTTRILGPQFFTRMKMSSQLRGYCWSFEKLTGMKIHGYIVNAIRTSPAPNYVSGEGVSRGRTGNSKSPEQWWSEGFARETYYLKQGWQDEWLKDTIEKVEQFFYHYQRGYMPMNTESCAKFNVCPYIGVCECASVDREIMLASGEFVDSTWSPLNRVRVV